MFFKAVILFIHLKSFLANLGFCTEIFSCQPLVFLKCSVTFGHLSILSCSLISMLEGMFPPSRNHMEFSILAVLSFNIVCFLPWRYSSKFLIHWWSQFKFFKGFLTIICVGIWEGWEINTWAQFYHHLLKVPLLLLLSLFQPVFLPLGSKTLVSQDYLALWHSVRHKWVSWNSTCETFQ